MNFDLFIGISLSLFAILISCIFYLIKKVKAFAVFISVLCFVGMTITSIIFFTGQDHKVGNFTEKSIEGPLETNTGSTFVEDTISPPEANNTVVDDAAEVFYGPVTDVVNNKIYDGPTGEVIHYSTDSPRRFTGGASLSNYVLSAEIVKLINDDYFSVYGVWYIDNISEQPKDFSQLIKIYDKDKKTMYFQGAIWGENFFWAGYSKNTTYKTLSAGEYICELSIYLSHPDVEEIICNVPFTIK